jgi:HD-like signal output (HDOD) protein
LEQASISNDEIVQVIKCDNVLTAKLLRACNSPYFGLDDPVSSVDQAVLMLGHQQILHIVLTWLSAARWWCRCPATQSRRTNCGGIR